MRHLSAFIIGCIASSIESTCAFVSQIQPFGCSKAHQVSTETELNAVTQDQLLSSLSSTSSYISTISADIDNISDDNFAIVFAGGIAVMIGGVLSTLIVGFLLESGNSYASVVADSYAQGGDEDFWESLSPEDQVKTKELLAKLKESKSGAGKDSSSVEIPLSTETVPAKAEKKELSMFSDYED